MKKAIKYFGIAILIMLVLGTTINVIQGTVHPLLALFTLGFIYLLLDECWFAIRFLFWFDELQQEYDEKAGERIVPRDRFTWELLTCWHGSTPQATRWRRRYNFRAIFAILMCCSIFIYGLLIALVLGAFGGSSGGSGPSGDGNKETPWQHRQCSNCRWGNVDGCQLADGGNRAGTGGSCSRWQPWR